MGLTEEKVIDLDLGQIKKSKIRVDHDQNRIIELNLSDMNIVQRMNVSYKNLLKLAEEATQLSNTVVNVDTEDEEAVGQALETVSNTLSDLDKKMRDEVDYLFDSKVSDVCLPTGTMYDPHDGMFTFEHIISSLANLYTNNFKEEFDKMRKNVEKHTGKYTKKPQDHQRKQK